MNEIMGWHPRVSEDRRVKVGWQVHEDYLTLMSLVSDWREAGPSNIADQVEAIADGMVDLAAERDMFMSKANDADERHYKANEQLCATILEMHEELQYLRTKLADATPK